MTLFLIAEIGINHNGDLAIARRLIDAAKDAGFDAVKFQKRTIDKVYTKELLDSPRDSPWGKTQRAQKEGLEFGLPEYKEIDRYCRENGDPTVYDGNRNLQTARSEPEQDVETLCRFRDTLLECFP